MAFPSFFAFAVLAALVAVVWTDCDLFLAVLPYKTSEKVFANKVIWVTGASSGIGASLAEELTAGGAQVVISARRVNELEEVADKCALVGLRPLVVPFDATDFNEHAKSFEIILQKFGRVDSLVLNAGRAQRATAMDTTLADTKGLFDLNFLSFVNLAKIVVPTMTSRPSGGQVVIVSSLSGRLGTPTASSYSATKYALHGYFDALRTEVNYENVNIQIVCPGPVVSEISKHAIRSDNGKASPEEKKMPTARCTYLMAKGMKWRLDETWISDQPYLAITYLNTYMPFTSRQLFKYVIGPARIKTLKNGGDMYNMKNMLGFGQDK